MSVRSIIDDISRKAHRIDQVKVERWLADVLDRIDGEIDRQDFRTFKTEVEQRPAVVFAPAAPEPKDPSLSFNKVRELLGNISPNHLNNLRHVGALTGFKAGRERYYQTSEVDAYLARIKIPQQKAKISRDLHELRLNRTENRERRKVRLLA